MTKIAFILTFFAIVTLPSSTSYEQVHHENKSNNKAFSVATTHARLAFLEGNDPVEQLYVRSSNLCTFNYDIIIINVLTENIAFVILFSSDTKISRHIYHQN